MIGCKSLANIKNRLAKKLKVGASRLSFKSEAIAKIYEQKSRLISRQTLDSISSMVTIKPKSKRVYKIYYNKHGPKTRQVTLANGKKVVVKNRFKDNNSLSRLLKRKILTKKDLWIRRIRQLRKELKEKKPKDYASLRRKIKANHFKSVTDLRRYLDKD